MRRASGLSAIALADPLLNRHAEYELDDVDEGEEAAEAEQPALEEDNDAEAVAAEASLTTLVAEAAARLDAPAKLSAASSLATLLSASDTTASSSLLTPEAASSERKVKSSLPPDQCLSPEAQLSPPAQPSPETRRRSSVRASMVPLPRGSMVLEAAHKRRKSSMAPRTSISNAGNGRRASETDWLYDDLEAILTQIKGTSFVLFRFEQRWAFI